MNIQQMMKQAQQMQERLQRQMTEMRVDGAAGGGMVAVVVNGNKQVLKIVIDPECVSKEDVEMLQDLILAAINDAQRKVDEALASQMQGMMGGLPDSRDVVMARPDPLAELVAALQRLPGIGARSAQRLAYHLMRSPREEVDALSAAMLSMKDRVAYCSICSNITDVDPCAYCTGADRDARLICVVEQPENIGAVERTRGFRGRYHVLMGAIAPLQGVGPDDLKIKGLLERLRPGGVEEVIVATNPNVEGEATALYLAKLLRPLGVRVTRIAMGVPVGSDLDYTDEFTMAKAMDGRREM